MPEMRYFICNLAFLFFDFVTSKIFLGFSESDVLSENWIVFLKRKLVRGVHSIFLGIILTNPRLFRDEANEFALSIILLCHIAKYFITYSLKSKEKIPRSDPL